MAVAFFSYSTKCFLSKISIPAVVELANQPSHSRRYQCHLCSGNILIIEVRNKCGAEKYASINADIFPMNIRCSVDANKKYGFEVAAVF